MRHVLLWLPLLWTLRFLLLVLTGGFLYISTLYLARFLRPENARTLFSGGLCWTHLMHGKDPMPETETIKKAREALERERELAAVSDRLREKSERLAEESEVLQRAAAIVRSRRERAGQ